MKKRKVDPWFPFWIDKWLFGSTRIELEPDERGVFVDLMTLSKKDEGYIRANEGVPYLENQICGLLNIEPELLQRTIKKCIKYGKAKKLEDGTLYMTGHEAYKLSGRQTRRLEESMSGKSDTTAKKPDAKNRIDKNKIEENKLYNNIDYIVGLLTKVKGIGKIKAERLANFIFEELVHDFKDVDILESVKKKCAWWLDHPISKKSNLHLQMRNWFKIGQGWIDERKIQDRVGRPRSKKPKSKEEIECEKFIQAAGEAARKENPGKRGRELEIIIMSARAVASRLFWRSKKP